MYWIFWTAKPISFQLTIYHGNGINSDLPVWVAEFNETPRGIHIIFPRKTVVPSYNRQCVNRPIMCNEPLQQPDAQKLQKTERQVIA